MSPNEGALFIDDLMQQQPGAISLDAETIARLEKKAAKLRKQGHNVL